MRKGLQKLIGECGGHHVLGSMEKAHQGWWRTFVLAQELENGSNLELSPGYRIKDKEEGLNFLTNNANWTAREIVVERKCGSVAEEDLYGNLMSSLAV